MCSRRFLRLDLTWPGRFRLESTKHVVNRESGAEVFPVTAGATQRGMDSSWFRTAYFREETLFSGLNLGTTFADATGSGLVPVTRYQETLSRITELSANSAHKSRCMPGPSPPACCITAGYRRNTTYGQAVHTECCPRQELAAATIS